MPACTLGQRNEEILHRVLGLPDAEIEELEREHHRQSSRRTACQIARATAT